MRNNYTIGILVSSLIQRHQKLLKKLSFELCNAGCTVFLFSGKGIEDNKIKGYIYDLTDNTWKPSTVIHFDVIYNRISTNQSETKFYEDHKDFASNNKIINKKFFSKWEVYNILSASEYLKPYLLDTNNKWTQKMLEHYLNEHGSIYCKNEYNSQGKGIFKLSKLSNNTLLFETLSKKIVFSNTNSFLKTYKHNIEDNYIYQETCKTVLFDGSKWDYRVLVHKHSNGVFIKSGVGIRVASRESNLVTHTMNNGSIIKYNEFPYKLDTSTIEPLIIEIGNMLEQYYGPLGEFSVDIGLSEEGILKIFEINSKPMIFDEIDIQNTGIANLRDMLIYYCNLQA